MSVAHIRRACSKYDASRIELLLPETGLADRTASIDARVCMRISTWSDGDRKSTIKRLHTFHFGLVRFGAAAAGAIDATGATVDATQAADEKQEQQRHQRRSAARSRNDVIHFYVACAALDDHNAAAAAAGRCPRRIYMVHFTASYACARSVSVENVWLNLC